MKLYLVLFVLFISHLACGGTNNLPVETGPVIHLSHVNKFQTALSGDLVPRDTSGAVGANSASLGQSAITWLKSFVASGDWSLGDIKPHHSYNGTAPIGEGWMLCDGRQITQANYDSEHGSGHWTTYVGSSPLLNRYLPDMTAGHYLTGAATTTQDGTVAITRVGNSGNAINLQHNHAWYSATGTGGGDDSSYNSGGTLTVLGSVGAGKSSSAVLLGLGYIAGSSNLPYLPGGLYYTSNSLSTAQSIQPDSVQAQYYMRVIQ